MRRQASECSKWVRDRLAPLWCDNGFAHDTHKLLEAILAAVEGGETKRNILSAGALVQRPDTGMRASMLRRRKSPFHLSRDVPTLQQQRLHRVINPR